MFATRDRCYWYSTVPRQKFPMRGDQWSHISKPLSHFSGIIGHRRQQRHVQAVKISLILHHSTSYRAPCLPSRPSLLVRFSSLQTAPGLRRELTSLGGMRDPSVPRTSRLVDSWLLRMNRRSCKKASRHGRPRKPLCLASPDVTQVYYPYTVGPYQWPLLEKIHNLKMLIQGRDPCPHCWNHR